MSKICVTTNISMLIFIFTCKQITQSKPTEFSTNGLFHSKAVVITSSKCLNLNKNLTLSLAPSGSFRQNENRNRILEQFLLTQNFGHLIPSQTKWTILCPDMTMP